MNKPPKSDAEWAMAIADTAAQQSLATTDADALADKWPPLVESVGRSFECRDYIMTEWSKVPVLPTNEHYERAWENIKKRAIELYGSDAVQHACRYDDYVKAYEFGFGVRTLQSR
jgi:hypothetical protein